MGEADTFSRAVTVGDCMRKLLLIDDSTMFLRVLESILQEHCVVVGKAQDGILGFEMYQKLKPDLVLMDITMPNLSGKDCLKKIMAFDGNAKVIMVSSIGNEGTVKECLSLGASGFVIKDTISLVRDDGNRNLLQTINSVLKESA